MEYLTREGVTAVLIINNLDQEINFRMINWDVITKYYPDQDIELVQVNVSDFEMVVDLNEKLMLAAYILNSLISCHRVKY